MCRGVNCLAIQTVAMAVGIVKLQLSDSDGKDTVSEQSSISKTMIQTYYASLHLTKKLCICSE